MSSFRNIGHCEIPNDWADISLGDEYKRPLLVMRNGLTKTQNDHDGTFKVSRIETISNGVIDESRVKYLSEVSREEEDKYLIRKNDILFSHINSDAHLGKTAIAKKDYDDLLHGMNLLLFRVNEEILDPEFLFFTTNYYKNIGVFISIGSRAVNQSSINQGKLKALKVPLPPLPEQRNIAHILSKIQSAIETQEKIIQTTTELKKALMQKLFTEGLKGEPQKETEIGLVPKSWKVKVFENIVTLQRGKDLPKDKFVQGKFHVGGSNGIIGYHNQFNTKAPGITVGRSGSCGKVVFYDKNFWAHNTALVVKDFHDNNEKFIYYFLCFLKLEKYKSGVSVPTLNRNAFRTIEMAIPKIDEQIENAKTLEQTDKKITMTIEKKNVFQSLFKPMLHHLMTGQIRVKDLRFS